MSFAFGARMDDISWARLTNVAGIRIIFSQTAGMLNCFLFDERSKSA